MSISDRIADRVAPHPDPEQSWADVPDGTPVCQSCGATADVTDEGHLVQRCVCPTPTCDVELGYRFRQELTVGFAVGATPILLAANLGAPMWLAVLAGAVVAWLFIVNNERIAATIAEVWDP